MLYRTLQAEPWVDSLLVYRTCTGPCSLDSVQHGTSAKKR